MVRIDSYGFGRMSVNGRLYTSDLVILPDGLILESWRRKEGHRLQQIDIAELIEVRPETIVAGTGASGLMKPDRDLEDFLARNNIAFIALPSEKAVDVFNRLAVENRDLGACFHLTC